MNYPSVARVLSLLMLLLAGAAAICMIIAVIAGEDQQIFTFSVTVIAIAVAAASVLLLTPAPPRRSRSSDGLAVVILWWLLAPLAAAMPFIFGVANSSVLTAIHEAAACLTTTGHSLIRVAQEDWPISLICWRGALHVIGACAAITMAAGVFAAVNLGGPGVHRTELFSIPETSFFDAMARIAVPVALMLVTGITFVFVILLVLGLPPGRALGDAVSVITTGLVHPDALQQPPGSPAVAAVLGIGLFFGSLGLALWLPLRRAAWGDIARDAEIALFVGLLFFFAVFAVLFDFSFGQALGWSLSTLSTSGIPLSERSVSAAVPLPVSVIPCLIGGSALAAAGGIKLARVIVLGQRAGQEFQQLGYRRSIVTFRFRDRELDERSVIGVWVYFVAYVLAVFLFVVGFSFAGLGFDDSIRLSIGGLTSAGGLADPATRNLTSEGELLLITAMLLGRLEILTLIPALSLSFWRG